MIRIYILVFIIAAFFWFKAYLQKEPQARKKFIKQSTVMGMVVCFVLLAMMGRLNWIFAALGVAVASITRFFPLLLRYAPQLQRLWRLLLATGFFSQTNPSSAQAAQSGPLSIDDAYKVLGLPASATRKEIIDAHRKLILKNHPDRGGSSYLAAQINQAKDILLKIK